MWDWNHSYKVRLYDTSWAIIGVLEYEFIYPKTVAPELRALFPKETAEGLEEAVKELMREVSAMTSRHFGQPYMNAVTVAGSYRMVLKRLAERYGKALSWEIVKLECPWWFHENRNKPPG